MYTRASHEEMKSRVMASFSQENSTLRIIIATTSFSMGIDIPDIRQIVHWGPPSDIEQYVQEIGRVGRDGKIMWPHLCLRRPIDSLKRL